MHRHCGCHMGHAVPHGLICRYEPRPCCSQLTALRVCEALGQDGDGDVAAVAEALPQLRALELSKSAQLASDAGLHMIDPL
jgi:hypothetical protein